MIASQSFRLHEVNTELQQENDKSRRLDVELAPLSSRDRPETNWITLVIGRNGQGKSRLLGGIAAMFSSAATQKRAPTARRGYNIDAVFSRGGELHHLAARGSRPVRSTLDLYPETGHTLGPSRVIALSATALDKFPLPPRNRFAERGDGEVYAYLGLRDSRGYASATAGVYHSLELLFDAIDTSDERRGRVADVFEFLNYSPRVEVVYQWRYSAIRDPQRLRDLLRSEDRPAVSGVAISLRRLVEREPKVLVELERIIAGLAVRTGSGRELRLVADFMSPSAEDRELFRDLRLLRKAGLVAMGAVELRSSTSGLVVDLRDLSSGEFTIVTTFLGLAAVIEDASLVLIDEPEVSLHPEWQSQYVELLSRTFSAYNGCHFIIATHSPLVVSDIGTMDANVVSLDPSRRSAEPAVDYAGDSVDEILVKGFRVPGNNNLYLKQLLVEAMRLAADGEIGEAAFDDVLQPLLDVTPFLRGDDPVRRLTEELFRAREMDATR